MSLLPSVLGLTGIVYFAVALVLGAGFVWTAFRFARSATPANARGLFRASILYLPLLMAVLVLDKL